MAIETSLVA